MTTAVIWLIISVLIMSTIFAMMAKEARIAKSKRIKILLLIPPLPLLFLQYGLFMDYLKISFLSILNLKNNFGLTFFINKKTPFHSQNEVFLF